MIQPIVIGLGCTRGVGKSLLADLLNQIDRRFQPYSFASCLKDDLAPFILEHYDISVWDCTAKEKELIRPFFISHGMAKRALDEAHWVKRTMAEIDRDMKGAQKMGISFVPVVADMRFVNEVSIFRSTYPGFRFINICRDGAPPPTSEEEKHYPNMVALADRHLVWGNDTPEEQLDVARDLVKWLGWYDRF